MEAALQSDIARVSSGYQLSITVATDETEVKLIVARNAMVLDTISEALKAPCTQCFMGDVDVSAGSFEAHGVCDGARLRPVTRLNQLIEEIMLCNPHANPGKMLSGVLFNENKLQSLPESFGNLRFDGNLWLNMNQLQSLPESFINLQVGGDLWLSNNELQSLPDSFEKLQVGGDLHLGNIKAGIWPTTSVHPVPSQTCTYVRAKAENSQSSCLLS